MNKTISIELPTNSEGKLAIINKVRDVLRGDRNFSSEQLKSLCVDLERFNQFAYASEILLVKMRMEEESGIQIPLRDYQKLVFYVYSDQSFSSSFKFTKALQKLQNHDDMVVCSKPGNTLQDWGSSSSERFKISF